MIGRGDSFPSLALVKSERQYFQQSSSESSVSLAGDLFENALPNYCTRLQCPYPVHVKKERLGDDPTPFPREIEDSFVICVSAVYDEMDRLCAIGLSRVRSVPRIFMQILTLLAEFYNMLTKISIRRCGIDVYTIYEMSRMLSLTSITDICFDDSPLLQGNFAILLDTLSPLRNLSLARCKINDEVCKEIALKLHYNMAGGRELYVLNLSSNQITDEGAKHLGMALRSNRRLRYLNLAGNRITDDGANHILSVLKKFRLTPTELQSMRVRFMKQLKRKKSRCVSIDAKATVGIPYSKESKRMSKKIAASIFAPQGNSKGNWATVLDFLSKRASIWAEEKIGPFHDPFEESLLVIENQNTYCLGNTALCWLNLSYNDLTLFSLRNVLEVLTDQRETRNANKTGLIKIDIEGNLLPKVCTEMIRISALINEIYSTYCIEEANSPQKKRTSRNKTARVRTSSTKSS